ncbi:MAG: putative quinol monooxygenase [Pseudonocardiaceae bacterium]
MTITVRAELRVLPGKGAEFLEAATALAETASAEAGTLRYDWYGSADPAAFVVIEEYTDPAAALAHNRHCEAFLHRLAALAEMTSVHLHGRLGPELEAWVAEHPVAFAHPPLRPETPPPGSHL